jgi:hypothetical protein
VSQDGTLEIVREYPDVTLVSEKDRGVYDAMDKASRFIRGDVVIFLNAGDAFFDNGVCEAVGQWFSSTRADIVFGNLLPYYVRPTDSHDHPAFQAGVPLDLSFMRNRRDLFDQSIHHQATFYRKWVLNRCTYACAASHATGEYNLLLNAVMKHGAKVSHLPATVTRFSLGGISTRDFNTEWDRYCAARSALRELYCPDRDHIEIAAEDEFHHSSNTFPMNAIKPSFMKSVIKRGFMFKVYDRVARGLTARIVNTSIPEIRGVLGLALEATKREILRDLELHIRASLAEVQLQLSTLRADIETRQQKSQAEVEQLLRRLDTTVNHWWGLDGQARSAVSDGRGLTIPRPVLREGTSLQKVAHRRSAPGWLMGALRETLNDVEADVMERVDNLVRSMSGSLSSVATVVRDMDSKTSEHTRSIEALSARMHECHAVMNTVASGGAELPQILQRVTQCSDELSRLANAVRESSNHVESGLTQRLNAVGGTIGDAVASVAAHIRDLDSKATLYGTRSDDGERMARAEAQITSEIAARAEAHRRDIDALRGQLSLVRESLGRLCHQVQSGPTFEESGFSVYSQWDEDGKLDFLISRCKPATKTFIEIGIGDYAEANTRYLAASGWTGLLVEADSQAVNRLRTDAAWWRYSIDVRNERVTAENINRIIGSSGLSGDIGILSIDVDGVDYWIWRAISIVRPCIVVCEYNAVFGASRALTVPYDPGFERFAKHHSGIYAGASLHALEILAESKGYTCVGCNSGGNNAFFVRTDVLEESGLSGAKKPFKPACFREARGPEGALTYQVAGSVLAELADMPIWDVVESRSVRLGDVLPTAEICS